VSSVDLDGWKCSILLDAGSVPRYVVCEPTAPRQRALFGGKRRRIVIPMEDFMACDKRLFTKLGLPDKQARRLAAWCNSGTWRQGLRLEGLWEKYA
jgi:hypothetical protein